MHKSLEGKILESTGTSEGKVPNDEKGTKNGENSTGILKTFRFSKTLGRIYFDENRNKKAVGFTPT
jgi:hypothetical protein